MKLNDRGEWVATEAERAVIDALVSRRDATGAIDEVLSERLSPELMERAVSAQLERIRATSVQSDVWDELAALGFAGSRMEPLWNRCEKEAKRRFEEQRKANENQT